jgi:mono/diheme cytochrome c family protein
MGTVPIVPVLAFVSLAVLALTGTACRQDMHDQPKIKAYRASDFWGDGRGMRPIPEGTVARGFLEADDLLYTGKVNGQPVDEFPFQVTKAVLDRGHDRFNIYCSPCHGRTGLGNGMIVQRGLKPPPSFHEEPPTSARCSTASMPRWTTCRPSAGRRSTTPSRPARPRRRDTADRTDDESRGGRAART